jgi:hypothetical protein
VNFQGYLISSQLSWRVNNRCYAESKVNNNHDVVYSQASPIPSSRGPFAALTAEVSKATKETAELRRQLATLIEAAAAKLFIS